MTNFDHPLELFHAWLLKHSTYKVHHYCDIADVNASIASKVMTQKKMIVKSDSSFTKHNAEHF